VKTFQPFVWSLTRVESYSECIARPGVGNFP
jgi:hypothetical protein